MSSEEYKPTPQAYQIIITLTNRVQPNPPTEIGRYTFHGIEKLLEALKKLHEEAANAEANQHIPF